MTKLPGTPARRAALLTVAEAAAWLRTSPKWLRRQIARGDLPVHRLGRLIRIAPEDLEVFLKSRRD